MNTQEASRKCENVWTPIVPWTGASTGFYGSATLCTEVEFVGMVLNQHTADMAEVGNAFMGCIDELLNVEPEAAP